MPSYKNSTWQNGVRLFALLLSPCLVICCFLRYLNLGLPMYIGGVYPTGQHNLPSAVGFEGCIRNVYVDEQLLDMADFLLENGTEDGCPYTTSCQSGPCRSGGTCQETYNMFKCLCPPGHVNTHCDKGKNNIQLPVCMSNFPYFCLMHVYVSICVYL